MLPPPAKELRPRRLTRKPRHTQRVWRLDIVGEAFDRWRGIGHNQGLSSDTEIAVFLMQQSVKLPSLWLESFGIFFFNYVSL